MKILKKSAVYFKDFNLTEKILYPFLCVLFLCLLVIAMSPIYTVKELEKMVEDDSLFSIKYNPLYNHIELSEMVREKTYKEAMLKLGEKDSIQLVINMADSIVCLYIKGVKIHQTNIQQFDQDILLKRMPNRLYVYLFSKPLDIKSYYATIVKEPIVIRQAPKDTIEAALNAWLPDTLVQNPAFLHLTSEYKINLLIEQDKNLTFHDNWVKLIFHSRLQARRTLEILKNFITFRNQDYHPTIKIKMPVDDLRAIYRALPHNASIVLYFP